MSVVLFSFEGVADDEVAQLLPSGGDLCLKVFNRVGYGCEPGFLFAFVSLFRL